MCIDLLSGSANKKNIFAVVHSNLPALRTVSFTNDSSPKSEYSLQECPTPSQTALFIVYFYCKMQPVYCLFGIQIKYCSTVTVTTDDSKFHIAEFQHFFVNFFVLSSEIGRIWFGCSIWFSAKLTPLETNIFLLRWDSTV